ncbi:hypothetical protein HMPREF9099_00629 [Lachnospiraceae bacterium oral taxon 082 str. F0431]|nr:hypothetical protein HMPREF9099_00629 [Lachnospiraceae bacterium oral taxon 082 str. F0431]
MKAIFDLFATAIIKGETRYRDILPIFKKGVKKSLKEKGHPELASDDAELATPSNATHEE